MKMPVSLAIPETTKVVSVCGADYDDDDAVNIFSKAEE